MGVVGVGADLAPDTIVSAYRQGLFPMPLEPESTIAWWSPDPRGILELDDLVIHRSLQKSCRRFEIRVDTVFDQVIAACADPRRPHGWIDSQICSAYLRLHKEGIAHSVETWLDGKLVGGLYGVAIGGLFAGESMFFQVRDASKAALVALVGHLHDGHDRIIDVQWPTDHLCSLGVTAVPRPWYLERLRMVLSSPNSLIFE